MIKCNRLPTRRKYNNVLIEAIVISLCLQTQIFSRLNTMTSNSNNLCKSSRKRQFIHHLADLALLEMRQVMVCQPYNNILTMFC